MCLSSALFSLLFKLQGIPLCVPDIVTHTLNARTSENLGILSSPPSAGYNILLHLRPGLHISLLQPPASAMTITLQETQKVSHFHFKVCSLSPVSDSLTVWALVRPWHTLPTSPREPYTFLCPPKPPSFWGMSHHRFSPVPSLCPDHCLSGIFKTISTALSIPVSELQMPCSVRLFTCCYSC